MRPQWSVAERYTHTRIRPFRARGRALTIVGGREIYAYTSRRFSVHQPEDNDDDGDEDCGDGGGDDYDDVVGMVMRLSHNPGD